ncbi:hypothetical protein [Hymenobacter fodinae]|uniref:hypothetical protein n=1 Tax=Hymenobacter fodinae TaxID=2510796 RepID=UPI0014368580|nr:hypothetical protein [Hymenobacter fodinae]
MTASKQPTAAPQKFCNLTGEPLATEEQLAPLRELLDNPLLHWAERADFLPIIDRFTVARVTSAIATLRKSIAESALAA